MQVEKWAGRCGYIGDITGKKWIIPLSKTKLYDIFKNRFYGEIKVAWAGRGKCQTDIIRRYESVVKKYGDSFKFWKPSPYFYS